MDVSKQLFAHIELIGPDPRGKGSVLTWNYEARTSKMDIDTIFSSDCENTVSRKCEYGVLEITSDTKVSSHELKTSDLTRLV